YCRRTSFGSSGGCTVGLRSVAGFGNQQAPRDRPCQTRVSAPHGDPTSRGWTTPDRRPRQRGPDQLRVEVGTAFAAVKQVAWNELGNRSLQPTAGVAFAF